jgi:hypothetical protein
MAPLILISAYQHLDWRLQEAITRSGVPLLAVYGCSDLVKVRSQLLSDALRSNADRFLFIDADMVPTAEQIWQLAESEMLNPTNAVSGCYLGRDGQLAAQLKQQTPIRLDQCERYLPCLAAGMGFSAIHRDSVERLRSSLPELRTETGIEWRAYFLTQVIADEERSGGETTYFSEDWAFWWRVRNLASAAFWLDTQLPIGHLRTSPYAPHPQMRIEPHGRGTKAQ